MFVPTFRVMCPPECDSVTLKIKAALLPRHWEQTDNTTQCENLQDHHILLSK